MQRLLACIIIVFGKKMNLDCPVVKMIALAFFSYDYSVALFIDMQNFMEGI